MLKFYSSVLAVAVSLTVSVSTADARINSIGLQCKQARDLVFSRGEIVMNTSRVTFDRFVSDQTYCMPGDYVKRGYADTRNKESCWVGYLCSSDDNSKFGGRGQTGRN